jgi:hypothetical protein
MKRKGVEERKRKEGRKLRREKEGWDDGWICGKRKKKKNEDWGLEKEKGI